MTIGIYSGSFDPVHIGHTMLASYIAQCGAVDAVWMLVSRINPLKEGILPPTPGEHRMAMLRIAVGDDPRLMADDTELDMPAPSYSYRTLCHLRDRYPQHSFRLIVGSDNIEVFDHWRDCGKILSEFGVLVYPRPGHLPAGNLPDGAEWITGAPTCDISSTFIRREVSCGHDIRHYVPSGVERYITLHRLYRTD